jgi:tRNA modification GTPase
MDDNEDIIVALATCGCNNGALGIIRTSGKGSINLVNRFTDIDLTERKGYTINYGHIYDYEGILLDEVLIYLFTEGRSYTKEESIEISCHNSKYILNKFLETLIKGGARMAKNGEFTRRAYKNGRFNLLEAESVADLIASKNKTAHDIALNQMTGVFSKKIQDFKDKLLDIGSKLESSIEFSEDDINFDENKVILDDILDLKDKVKHIIDNYEKGQVIKKGLPIALIGKPNVGKSSLLNTLLEEDRVIVSDIPGTTRDTIDAEIMINDINCRFIDTAGLRDNSNDIIENIGIEKTKKTIEKASLILYLIDVNMSENDYIDDLNYIKNAKKDYILVVNKIDLKEDYKIIDEDIISNNIIYISTLKNIGIDKIKNYISEKYKVKEDEFIVNLRHLEIFKEIFKNLESIENGIKNNISNELLMIDVNNGLNLLNKIVDSNSSEEVLDNIFSKFCIGK